jgi:hypothetical protein
MAERDDVTAAASNGAVPDVVRLATDVMPRFTPNQIRALKAETGRTFTELLGTDEDTDDGDRMQALVWIELRRRGLMVPWDACGDIAIEFAEVPEPDPTNGEPLTPSPGSAVTGG